MMSVWWVYEADIHCTLNRSIYLETESERYIVRERQRESGRKKELHAECMVGLLGLQRLHPLHSEQKHLLGDRFKMIHSEGKTERKGGRERKKESELLVSQGFTTLSSTAI